MNQKEFDQTYKLVKAMCNQGKRVPWGVILETFQTHPMYRGTVIQRARKLFSSSVRKRELQIDDAFIWDLAEALLWRDEEVSMAAIPSPIREQPDADKYYRDAEYLIKFVHDRMLDNLEKNLSTP